MLGYVFVAVYLLFPSYFSCSCLSPESLSKAWMPSKEREGERRSCLGFGNNVNINIIDNDAVLPRYHEHCLCEFVHRGCCAPQVTSPFILEKVFCSSVCSRLGRVFRFINPFLKGFGPLSVVPSSAPLGCRIYLARASKAKHDITITT